MNHSLTLAQAIEGFLLAKNAEGKSHYTIRNYTLDLRRLAEFVGAEIAFDEIDTDHLRRFLNYLQPGVGRDHPVAGTPGPCTRSGLISLV